MNDTATISGIKNDRDEIDTLLAFITGDLDDTEATEFLDGVKAASGARYTDEELARMEAEQAAIAKHRELVELRHKAIEDNPCRRCGGSGELPHYRHIENGDCFRCGGLGIEPGASYGGVNLIV